MKKAIIPTAILCTVVCIGLHTQSQEAEQPITTPEPLTVEVVVMPTPTPRMEIEITEPELENPVVEVIMPEPTPDPAVQPPVSNQSVQAGDMVYVPGFGWIESQGEGTVTYDENMRENGNKVGIMG